MSSPHKQLLSPSPAMSAFFADLHCRTRISCIQIQCDNARKHSFCVHKKCTSCGSYLSGKNNSMPDTIMKQSQRGCNCHDTTTSTLLLDNSRRDHHFPRDQELLRHTKPRSPSMSSVRTNRKEYDHVTARWTAAGEKWRDTRGPTMPLVNACWSYDPPRRNKGCLFSSSSLPLAARPIPLHRIAKESCCCQCGIRFQQRPSNKTSTNSCTTSSTRKPRTLYNNEPIS